MSPPDPSAETASASSRSVTKAAAAVAALLAILFLAGPKATVEVPDQGASPPADPAVLDAWLAESEARVSGLRPGEAAGVTWAEPGVPASTALSVVYLHGFSADRHEVDPFPRLLADSLGANLFHARLTGHGRDGAALAEASAGDWLGDAAEAVKVGAHIGGRVVLVGTSTGATLALWAAKDEGLRDALAALVLVSPNLQPADRSSRLLLWPWGAHIARAVVGEERCFEPENEAQARHWTTCYPVEALVPMMALVEHVRDSDPARVRAPLLVFYDPADLVVDAGETARRFERWGSEAKRLTTVDGVGDPSRHVLAGDVLSPGTTASVLAETLAFLRHTGVAPGPAAPSDSNPDIPLQREEGPS